MKNNRVQGLGFRVQRSRNKNLLFVFCLLSFFLYPVRCTLYAEIVEGIVAVVNNEVITRLDLEQYLAPLYFQYQSEYKGAELEEKLKQLQKDGLRQLIEEKLLLSEAKKRKMTADPKGIGQRIEEVKARFSSEEEFYSTLSQQNLTEEDLQQRYRDQLMIQQLIEEEVRYKVTVSPSEVNQYYNSHLEEFNIPERIKLRSILIKAEVEEQEEEAFIRIHEMAVLLEKGQSFEELSKQYSEGPHAQEGGLMGLVAKGELSRELEPVVFSLEVGKVSEVVKTSLGYHLFKVEEKIPAQVKPLAEAQHQIQQHLRKEKTEMRYKSFMGELRAKAYISIK